MTRFPKDFLWGTATASYQIEGAVHEDGRGPSIWDEFSHLPGKTAHGDTGDIACDHYHRYPGDIKIIQQMGCNAYRTSVAWSRIFPEGKGPLNQAGLDFYQRLVDSLLEASIQPAITLFHWDLPAKLQEQGGWVNRDLVHYFRDYANCLFEALGDRVHQWITLNEPAVHSICGHLLGNHAPGISDWKVFTQTAHHLLLAHGEAVQAFRQGAFQGQVGLTLNLTDFQSASNTAADVTATQNVDGLWNRWFLDPVFRGHYPEDMKRLMTANHLTPNMQDADLALIQSPLDFLGINYYFRSFIKADPTTPIILASALPAPAPTTAMGWEIYPEGLYRVLQRIHKEYAPTLPLYITENGAAFDDQLDGDAVHDPGRIAFLREHFHQAGRAIADGVNLKGYYVWSLLDNFEWAYGYDKRFGLIYIDYPSQKRIWKDSAHWVQNFLKTGVL